MHDLNDPFNQLDHDVGFSRTLYGKECMACKRALAFSLFNRDSSVRDGYAHLCQQCEVSPRLSTAEHVSRLREMNNNSHALAKQRRPDEAHYQSRDFTGKRMEFQEFIRRLKKIYPYLIVADAYFLNESSLYITDLSAPSGVRYVGYLNTGVLNENSRYRYNERNVPVEEVDRGWRSILLKMILLGVVTDQAVREEFGPSSDFIWNKTIFNFKNQVTEKVD